MRWEKLCIVAKTIAAAVDCSVEKNPARKHRETADASRCTKTQNCIKLTQSTNGDAYQYHSCVCMLIIIIELLVAKNKRSTKTKPT